ncbi:MAG: molybdopterin converting factor subunit 1 [Gemmataceae bacterium]
MTTTVKLFARARDLVGCDRLVVSLPEGSTVADLRTTLAQQHPRLALLLPSCRVAVDAEFADDRTKLLPSCEVAIIPPVSGG